MTTLCRTMKKNQQLGMNPGTASHRLLKDILFDFVIRAGHKCFQCGGDMTREDFSIEHKEPWIDSADPVGMFFDLKNIAFSHKRCNFGASRRPGKRHFTEADKIAAHRARSRRSNKKSYTPEKRRAQYLRTGK